MINPKVTRFTYLVVTLFLMACQNSAETSEQQLSSSETEPSKVNEKPMDKSQSQPKVTTGKAVTSRSLRELSEEQSGLDKTDCEEQFKNKNGVCEVPNHPFPKELRDRGQEQEKDPKKDPKSESNDTPKIDSEN